MARTIRTVITCDQCNEELESIETAARHFGVGNNLYEVDLCAAHARAFDEALTPYIAVSKIVDQRKSTMKRPVGQKTKRDPEAIKIREWALGKGIAVAARGRIPADIREQYLADTKSARAS